MDPTLLLLELVAFSLAWWLGFYLLGRDLQNPQLRFTGLGLATYALALAADLLSQHTTDPDLATTLARWVWPLLFLPALFWFGSLVYLLPEETPFRQRFGPLVSRGLFPVALIFYLVAGGTELFVTVSESELQPGPGYFILALLLAALLLGAVQILGRALRQQRPVSPLGLILAATLFFGLGLGLLLIPLEILPRSLMALGLGLDLALLGVAIAFLDAFGQGEALLPDVARSFAFAFFVVLLFGGQVALVMAVSTGVTLPMLLLLLAVVMTAVATQTLADPIQSGLDWLVFRRIPRIRQARADWRIVSSAAPRTRDSLDPGSLTETQFTRLTRRALSQMGNLPRLAASPLTRLEVVEERLVKRGADDNTLERAAELKSLLSESIERLKPRGLGEFGTADQWRHYNGLYYPYVVGLKPYSRRADYGDLDSSTQDALAWFQTQVPERTLYNWQNAAAKLVARDLLEGANGGVQDEMSAS